MKIKIDIFSGFLGSGKTTLIKKLIEEKFKDDKVAIIENEFGEVSIDGEILKGSNVDVKEINSGCICCSIVGDFKKSIKDIIKTYTPTRIIIEPSGVAKLSDVIKSCKSIKCEEEFEMNYIFTLVDVSNFNMYLNNFGEFYKDQLIHGKTILLSRSNIIDEEKLKDIVAKIREINKSASIIASPLETIDGFDICEIADNDIDTLKEKQFSKLTSSIIRKTKLRGEDKKSNIADSVFDTVGIETTKIFTESNLKSIFNKIDANKDFGFVLRGKGLVRVEGGKWVEFHYTPGEFKIKETKIQLKGKIAIIGEKIDKSKLRLLFK